MLSPQDVIKRLEDKILSMHDSGASGKAAASAAAAAALPVDDAGDATVDEVDYNKNAVEPNFNEHGYPSVEPNDFASTTNLIIFAHRRSEFLERCLRKVIKLIPAGMRVIISRDGSDPSVSSVITDYVGKFAARGNPAFHYVHSQKAGENGYQRLSQHYGFGLNKAFEEGGECQRVIILEEGERARLLHLAAPRFYCCRFFLNLFFFFFQQRISIFFSFFFSCS